MSKLTEKLAAAQDRQEEREERVIAAERARLDALDDIADRKADELTRLPEVLVAASLAANLATAKPVPSNVHITRVRFSHVKDTFQAWTMPLLPTPKWFKAKMNPVDKTVVGLGWHLPVEDDTLEFALSEAGDIYAFAKNLPYGDEGIREIALGNGSIRVDPAMIHASRLTNRAGVVDLMEDGLSEFIASNELI